MTNTTAPAAKCTGTESIDEVEARIRGMVPANWHLRGRLVCTTCGNCALPNRDGRIRRHVAKPMG